MAPPLHDACAGSNKRSAGYTDVDAPARLLLAIDEVLHPVDVVQAQRDSGDEALQRDLDGQAKVFL